MKVLGRCKFTAVSPIQAPSRAVGRRRYRRDGSLTHPTSRFRPARRRATNPTSIPPPRRSSHLRVFACLSDPKPGRYGPSPPRRFAPAAHPPRFCAEIHTTQLINCPLISLHLVETWYCKLALFEKRRPYDLPARRSDRFPVNDALVVPTPRPIAFETLAANSPFTFDKR
jgi:hypothetical protein